MVPVVLNSIVLDQRNFQKALHLNLCLSVQFVRAYCDILQPVAVITFKGNNGSQKMPYSFYPQ